MARRHGLGHFGVIGVIVMVLCTLGACFLQVRQAIAPAPLCYLQPQATGEKIILPTIEATPAAEIATASDIVIVFSGNFLIINNAVICGEVIERYVHSDTLPDFSWDRQVEVLIGERLLTTVKCGYTCRIEASIPADLLSGVYQLTLKTNYQTIRFDIQIFEN